MDTHTTEPSGRPDSLFNPLSGWEAASRWNAATFDLMARAWQQWIALLTVVPPHVVPTRGSAQATREQHAFASSEPRTPRSSSEREAKPAARREPKRTPARKPAGAKARSTRSRG